MKYKLQEVCEKDRDILFEWVNDKQYRKNTFHSEAVSYEEHCRWFSQKLADRMCYMYIYYYEDVPIGQVCIDCEAETGCISYFIASEYRGQGHGYNMLQLVEYEMQEKVKNLTACVKYDNVASQIVFKKSNYKELEEIDCLKYCKEIDGSTAKLSENNLKVIILTNNRNALKLISYLEQKGESLSIISCRINLDMVKRINPKIIISYNYKYVVGSEVINYVNGEIFNLHISFLPWNRGSSPNYWSFVENTPKGVTIHQMDKGLDTGDIIIQEEMFFDEERESFSSSYEKLNDRIVELFIQNWESIKDRTYQLKKQEGEGSYHTIKDFKKFTKGNVIDWNENIADYKRKLERRENLCISHTEDNQ